jgi:putative transposase
VAQQLREATSFGTGPRYLIRDNDSKYGRQFAAVAAGANIKVMKTPIAAPNANAVCERFLGSVRRECLDHCLLFGRRAIAQTVKEYVHYFNKQRPHQTLSSVFHNCLLCQACPHRQNLLPAQAC